MKETPELLASAVGVVNLANVDAQTDGNMARHVAEDPNSALLLTDGETAAAIAASFHMTVGALLDWEQNQRQPDAQATAYLRVISREPDMAARAAVAS